MAPRPRTFLPLLVALAPLGLGTTAVHRAPSSGAAALLRAPVPAGADLEEDTERDPGAPTRQLSDLRRTPSRWAGRTESFAFVVKEVGRVHEPYLTRFDGATWLRVEAWSDEAPLWEREAFDDPVPYLFARRGSPVAERLAASHPYERWRAVATVRQVYAGEPWIELLALEPAEPGLTEAGLFHAARALELADQGRLTLAASELERALAGPLPPHHRSALEDLLDAWRGAEGPRPAR